MNYQKMVEWFFDISEKIMTYVINVIFLIMLALPLLIVDFATKEILIRIPILFIPLASLYAMGLKSIMYAFYMVYFKNKLYYKTYFIKSLTDDFIKQYLYYIVTIALLYFSLTSTYYLIQNISHWFLILFSLIVLFLLSHIIYTTIQFSLYENDSIKSVIYNSIILSAGLGVVTIGLVIILAALIYFYQYHTIKVVVLGIPIYSFLLILVHKIIENNKK